MMSEANASEVRIVELAPSLMASAYGFGESPEGIALDKLLAYGKAKGLLDAPHRIFGFDNPSPSPGSPNYGYEVWLTVAQGVDPEGDIRLQHFGGGLYAVARCKLPEIGQAWKELVAWREGSEYLRGSQRCLEEVISPWGTSFEETVIDIYLSIAR